MSDENQQAPQPATIPKGIPIADRKAQGPLLKSIGRMLAPKMKTHSPHGIKTHSTVHFSHGKKHVQDARRNPTFY